VFALRPASTLQPVRILIGMPDPHSLGGPATCEPPFVTELRGRGIDVLEEIYVSGTPLEGITFSERVRRVLRTARTFRSLLSHHQFDIVHLNTSFDLNAMLRDIVCINAMRRRTKVLFLKMHGSDPSIFVSRNPVIRLLRWAILSRVDAVGVLSTEERARMLEIGVPAEKVSVVKNVVELSTFSASSTGATDRSLSRPTLLFIARMVPTKGLLHVVRACRILQSQGRKFALVCVGDGPARKEAELEARSLGIESIHFTGQISEAQAAQHYLRSTMLVFPTHHGEGFSLTIFKAVAAGLPVLTTRIRAAADYLSEPENCLWIRPFDPEGLASRITELLDEPLRLAAMRENNLVLGRQFSSPKVTSEYIQLYETLVRRHSPEAIGSVT